MVKHIVMWKLSEECDKAAACAEIKAALEDLNGKIPGMTLCRVNPTYKGTHDLALESEFETAADEAAYQDNPLHVACKKIVAKYAVERSAADYEF